jgi:hypothetical protein
MIITPTETWIFLNSLHWREGEDLHAFTGRISLAICRLATAILADSPAFITCFGFLAAWYMWEELKTPLFQDVIAPSIMLAACGLTLVAWVIHRAVFNVVIPHYFGD